VSEWHLIVIVVVVCLFVLVEIAVHYYFWDRSRGPILWNYGNANSPLSFERSGVGLLKISAFHMQGTHRGSNPITPTKAYIRSNVSGRTMPMSFEANRPVNTTTISPGTTFALSAVLGGEELAQFKKEFSSFTFVFESFQRNYSISFDEDEVLALIECGEDATSLRPGPGAIFRSN
jgi:hypothetical protein